MSESCNSRHFSWLMKSCFPNPDETQIHHPRSLTTTTAVSAISFLPDDLVLECLSRVPSSAISSVSLVCRRWSRIIHSADFLRLRRDLQLLHCSLFAVSATDFGFFAVALSFKDREASWKEAISLPFTSLPLSDIHGSLSHARPAAIGPRMYLIGRNGMLRYDTWSKTVISRSPMIFPRKKFASAVVSDKIYVAGGCGSRAGASSATTVEEYDPVTDVWAVVAHANKRRYGCIGAAVDGVFYVIGGLRIGRASVEIGSRAAGSGSEAHVYASSMDLFDVESRMWLRSRTVPGGGCVVAACAAMGHLYVIASHAVELSFWRFNAQRRNGSGGFGEWSRLKSPPLPTQVRLDGTVRFSCVGVGDKVALVQVVGCIDDLLRRSGRTERGLREALVLVYDTAAEEWSRVADLPEVIGRAACACVEC